MNTFRDPLNQRLKGNESFRKEYAAIQPEMEIIRTLVKARREQNLTQTDLVMRTDINPDDISRLERGNRNPSLNMSLHIEFTPKRTASEHLS